MAQPTRLATCGLLLALGSCGGSGADPAAPARGAAAKATESVVLFTVDTLRADRLGCYGDADARTPHIDRLAGEGLLFLSPYTQASHTHAAMSAMLTGLYPQHTGVLGMSGTLAEGVDCVAVAVARAGIATGSFASSHCSPGTMEDTVWHDGWDVVSCIRDEAEHWDWDRRVVANAMEWMKRQEGPFLCWIHLIDPHGEHVPPPRHWKEGEGYWSREEQVEIFQGYANAAAFPRPEELDLLNRLYDAEVRGVDDQVGRVLKYLETRADADRIAFVLSADHGEELFQTATRWGHGRVLTEAVLRVPLIVRAPGLAPGVVREPVETLQVTPTIYELLDVPLKRALDGKSLLAAQPSRGHAISYYGNTVTIRRDDLRGWLNSDTLPKDPMSGLYEEIERKSPVPWFSAKTVAARYADPAGPYLPTYLPEAQLEAEELQEEIWRPLQEHLATLKPVLDLHEQALEGAFLEELRDMGYVGDE